MIVLIMTVFKQQTEPNYTTKPQYGNQYWLAATLVFIGTKYDRCRFRFIL